MENGAANIAFKSFRKVLHDTPGEEPWPFDVLRTQEKKTGNEMRQGPPGGEALRSHRQGQCSESWAISIVRCIISSRITKKNAAN